MTLFISSTLNGITLAAMLFMLATGFTLIYGLMRLLNLAHGAIFLWGGYLAVTLTAMTGNYLVGLVAAAVVVTVGGLGVERLLIRRVQGEILGEVLLTVALALILADLALVLWGGNPRTVQMPESLRGSLPVLGARVPWFRVLVVITAGVVMTGFWYAWQRTRIGAMIRACVDDKEMVEAIGINTQRVYQGVWTAGLFLTAVAGAFGAVLMSMFPGLDFEVLVLALIVVVIGGLGNVWGAALGSLVVGLSWTYSVVYVPELLYFILFLPMLIVLVFRPQGLLGATTR
jgi:branched-chain amino acid transport system permease protein